MRRTAPASHVIWRKAACSRMAQSEAAASAHQENASRRRQPACSRPITYPFSWSRYGSAPGEFLPEATPSVVGKDLSLAGSFSGRKEGMAGAGGFEPPPSALTGEESPFSRKALRGEHS